MMKTNIIPTLLLFTVFLFSCNSFDSNQYLGAKQSKISNTEIENYIKLYGKLRNNTPELIELVNRKKDVKSHAAFKEFETVIRNSGFDSFEEFEQFNIKVALLFSMVHGIKAADEYKNMGKTVNDMFDEGIAEFDKQLNDPSIPESAKEDLRKAKEALQQGKQSSSGFKGNVGENSWENEVIERFNKRSSWKISKEELQLVSQYEQDLAEAFEDLTLPRMIDID